MPLLSASHVRRRSGVERARLDLLLTLSGVLAAFAAAEWLDLSRVLEGYSQLHPTLKLSQLVSLGAILAGGMALFAWRRWRDAALAARRRAHAIRELHASERRFAAAFRASPFPQLVASLGGGLVLEANEAFLELAEVEAGQVVNRPLRSLSLWQSADLFSTLPGLLARGGSIRNLETTLSSPHGEPREVLLAASVMEMDGARCILVGLTDISPRKQAERDLSYRAMHDALTGLPNRALLHDRVTHALARAGRSLLPPTVLVLGLDGFRWINESFGHDVGDEMLRQVAGRLGGCLRASDSCARLDGDLFGVLIEDADDHRGVARVAERMLQALGARFSLPGIDTSVSVSIGIARAESGMDADGLLSSAELAMHIAKGSGKGRFALYDASMYRAELVRSELENDTRGALERGEFRLHYQPVASFSPHAIIGFEALVRWEHPVRGLLGPDEFIPLAEENGSMLELGRWVLRTACAQCADWQREFPREVPVGISVNLSPRQLADPGLANDVAEALRQSGLPAASLTLEFTENALVQNDLVSAGRLRELKRLGVQLAIDNFGTGYTTLAYLQRFPVDVLKVHRSFTDQLGDAGTESPITAAVFALGQSLKLRTVAEGIESDEQRNRLMELGCEYGQGFLIARPAPAAEAGLLLRGEPVPVVPLLYTRPRAAPHWTRRRREVARAAAEMTGWQSA